MTHQKPLTDREREYGVQVSRNGYGFHVGTWARGSLSDLTVEMARELRDKLTAELEAHNDEHPVDIGAWMVVPSSPGQPWSEADPRRSGFVSVPASLETAHEKMRRSKSDDRIWLNVPSISEACRIACENYAAPEAAYIIDRSNGTYTVIV